MRKIKQIKSVLLILTVLMLTLSACSVENPVANNNQRSVIGENNTDTAQVTPSVVIAGSTAVVRYTGFLKDGNKVYLHYGFNSWAVQTTDVEMVKNEADGSWEGSISIPADATQLDLVFNNGNGQWDNNNQNDWHYAVSLPSGSFYVWPVKDFYYMEIMGEKVQAFQNGQVVKEAAFTLTHSGAYFSSSFYDLPYGAYTLKMDVVKNGYRYVGESTINFTNGGQNVSFPIQKIEAKGLLIVYPLPVDGNYNNDILGQTVSLYKDGTWVTNCTFGTDHAANIGNLPFGDYTVKVNYIKDGFRFIGETSVSFAASGQGVNINLAKTSSVLVYPSINGSLQTGRELIGKKVQAIQNGTVVQEASFLLSHSGYYFDASLSSLPVGTYTFKVDTIINGYKYSCQTNVTINAGSQSIYLDVIKTAEAQKIIHYHNSSWSTANIHYRAAGGSWTTAPGISMNKKYSPTDFGWFEKTVTVAGELEFCFNNGNNNWDSANGANYRTSANEIWIFNGQVYTSKPSITTFRIWRYTIPAGSTMYINGNTNPLDWNNSVAMKKSAGGEWVASIMLPEGSFEYKFTYGDTSGVIHWENVASGANRTGTSGNNHVDTVLFN